MSVETREMLINMGPQHPSTHGVLRIILKLDGERIAGSEPEVGYLHRGFEKLAENMLYQQFIPYTDRLDYLASMNNNQSYVVAVERLLGIKAPPRAQAIRVIMSELGRIASHLVWLATHALDIGAMTVFLYCFREREAIIDLFEAAAGNRLNYNYARIGGVAFDLPKGFKENLQKFLDIFPEKLDEYHRLLTKNRIWLSRTKGIGILTKEQAINWGTSGPVLRGSGVEWDIRKAFPYDGYENYDFDVPTNQTGDVYGRYLVRMEEMRQSRRIIQQAIEHLPDGPVILQDSPYVSPSKEKIMTENFSLMKHMVLTIKGMRTPVATLYSATENPKGELGFYIVSDGSGKPYKLKIRAPSFINISAMPAMLKGNYVADVIAVIGSLDFVFGECDR